VEEQGEKVNAELPNLLGIKSLMNQATTKFGGEGLLKCPKSSGKSKLNSLASGRR